MSDSTSDSSSARAAGVMVVWMTPQVLALWLFDADPAAVGVTQLVWLALAAPVWTADRWATVAVTTSALVPLTLAGVWVDAGWEKVGIGGLIVASVGFCGLFVRGRLGTAWSWSMLVLICVAVPALTALSNEAGRAEGWLIRVFERFPTHQMIWTFHH